jgi:hypothetical protein
MLYMSKDHSCSSCHLSQAPGFLSVCFLLDKAIYVVPLGERFEECPLLLVGDDVRYEGRG